MESHTIQVLLDQAQAELEAAERRERETELRILHSTIKGRRETVRVLVQKLGSTQQVRNILIRIRNIYFSSGSDPATGTLDRAP
jgi:hypothetical protein